MHCKFDPYTVKCVDAAFKKSSWKDFQERIRQPNFRWTVAHGDAHPGNFVWDAQAKGLVLVDFEMIGPRNPMVDVATFICLSA